VPELESCFVTAARLTDAEVFQGLGALAIRKRSLVIHAFKLFLVHWGLGQTAGWVIKFWLLFKFLIGTIYSSGLEKSSKRSHAI
jgi:hypothetical protein